MSRQSGVTRQAKDFPCRNPNCEDVFKKHRHLVLHMKVVHGVEL